MPYIEKLESVLEIIQKVEDILKNEQGWNVESSDDTSKVSYKLLPNSKMYTLKIEREMEIPLENLLTVIFEIDLFNNWVPFCKESSTIKIISKTEKVAYFNMSLPLFSTRESYLRGMGINKLDKDGSIWIIGNSVEYDLDYLK